MQHAIVVRREKAAIPRVPNTLVTLTHPYSVVTFRLKALYFKDMTREKTLGGLFRR